MNRILIISNVIFFSIAIFLGVKLYSKDPEPNTEPVACEKQCKSYNDEKFEGLPAGLAFTMISKYKANHWNNYSVNGVPRVDARSVWFSLDSMKKFIWNLEQDVCNNKCVDKTELGLRFYYAEYPDKADWESKDPLSPNASTAEIDHRSQYPGLHTVVISPTYYCKEEQFNVDFDPRFVDKACKPINMQSVFKSLDVQFDTIKNQLVATNGGQPAFVLTPDVKTSLKNRGSLIPPPPFSAPGSIVAGELNGAVIFDMMENVFHTYH